MWSENDRERRQHVRPQHGADADARQRHRHLRRHRQHGVRTTWSPTRSARAAACTSAPASAPSAFAGHLWITDNTTVRAGTYELNWNIGLGAIWFYALEKNIDADIQVVGDHFLDNTYNAIMLVADWPVKDLYSITNVHFKDIQVDGTGTSVVSARVGRLGVVRERGRPQRRRRRRQQLRLVPLHRRPARSSRSTDLGGNDGGGTTGPVARAVGAAEHHHLRRPPAGRTAAPLALVVTTRSDQHQRRRPRRVGGALLTATSTCDGRQVPAPVS